MSSFTHSLPQFFLQRQSAYSDFSPAAQHVQEAELRRMSKKDRLKCQKYREKSNFWLKNKKRVNTHRKGEDGKVKCVCAQWW